MALTEEQKKEAEERYINERLRPYDIQTKELVAQKKAVISEAQRAIETAQNMCSHPMIARDTKNDGYSGEVWEKGHYWTEHTCNVCGLRWRTNQRWKHVGGKEGRPNDEAATHNPRED